MSLYDLLRNSPRNRGVGDSSRRSPGRTLIAITLALGIAGLALLAAYADGAHATSLILCSAALTAACGGVIATWLRRDALRRAKVHRARAEDTSLSLRLLAHDLAGLLNVARDNLELGLEDIHERSPSAKAEDSSLALAQPSLEQALFAMAQGVDLLRYVRDSMALRADGRDPFKLAQERGELFLASEAITDAVRLWSPTARRKRIRILVECRLHPLETCAVGAGTLFAYSIVGNLLTNALKFTPAAGTVRLTLREEKADAPGLVLDVEDQGVGIPEARIATLFDLQQNRSTPGTEGEAGTGFGLPLVKACLDLLGGEISVLRPAQPGSGGAHFRVRLPRAQPDRTLVSRFGARSKAA